MSSNSSPPSFLLATPQDEAWLTPLHCFIRQYCIEVFDASPQDANAPYFKGKQSPISVGQIGIRCPFCAPSRMNGNGRACLRESSAVFPPTISKIYSASLNLIQGHFKRCLFVPVELVRRYEELKCSNGRSGASKKYWTESARRVGLVDTPDGIRRVSFEQSGAQPDDEKDTMAKGYSYFYRNFQSKPGGANDCVVDPTLSSVRDEAKEPTLAASKNNDTPSVLVTPSDKRCTTAFTFYLISQLQPCTFTEANRIGRRRNLQVGFPGLACCHCCGVRGVHGHGSGRFFPSSIKTMADASKTLNVIFKHVIQCQECPSHVKEGLINLRGLHDGQLAQMPFGSQRAFFVKVWQRLHETNDHGMNITVVRGKDRTF